MDKVIWQNGKEVPIFVTPEGVTGIVATSISIAAIDGLIEKLKKRIESRQLGVKAAVIVEKDPASGTAS